MKSNRLQSLDALRGLAALSVVLFHYTVIVKRFIPGFIPPFTFTHGYYGVELFFIISGFVIFMTLQRSNKGLDFVVSRFSRLYPAFWACVSLTFLVGIAFPLEGQHYTLGQYVINLTMLQEYLKKPNIDGVYWSLTYELGFYFIMFIIFQLKQLKHIEKICLFWALAPILFHYFYRYIPHPLHYLLLINKYAHLFAAGICFYLIKQTGFTLIRILILTATVLTQAIIAGWASALLIFTFLLVFYFAMMGKIAILHFKPIVFIGVISYPLYLIHQMIGFKIIDTLHNSLSLDPSSSILIALTIIIGAASSISYLIEKPSTKLIRHDYLTLKK